MKVNGTKDLIFPSLDDFKQGLNDMNLIDWTRVSQENIEKYIPDVLKNLALISVHTNYDGYLYRTRSSGTFPKIDQKSEDNINLLSSFKYPPPGRTEISRANFKGQPVFYASSDINTSIFESRSSGEIDFIGCWKIKPNCNFKVRPFLGEKFYSNVESGHFFRQPLKDLFSDSKNIDVLLEIEKFHERKFTEQVLIDEQYLYTAWLANKILNSRQRNSKLSEVVPNAILYKSTIDNKLGFNFAVNTDFVDSSMYLEKIYLVRHIRHVDRFKRIIYLCGDVHGSEIKWHLTTQRDFNEFCKNHHTNEFAYRE